MKMELDKLSNLPSEIIDQILYKMPIKEAGSFLSSSSNLLKFLAYLPQIQRLILENYFLKSIRDDEAVAGEVNSWLDDNRSCQFSQLWLVKIFGLRGVIAELEFIRFVLLRSPILESMTVKPRSDKGSSELFKKWLRFKRVSVDAEIIYLDP
ncbi:uncharacterized protein LOC121050629 [Rosa chinensis]|uniref:uncharacterized protein LOC121050629 n=1 Tax=Rosa chinensis TaxID=74649 RepID=UPI001AD8EA5B|nr:uncharacterized protein LOC121050629 [Rosa chinensis]